MYIYIYIYIYVTYTHKLIYCIVNFWGKKGEED